MSLETFHPDRVLQELARTILGPAGVDACGIALLMPEGNAFQVLSYLDRRRERHPIAVAEAEGGGGAPNGTNGAPRCNDSSFRAEGTVGRWVLDTGLPLVTEHVGHLADFPNTADSLLRKGFASNFVAPLELSDGHRGVVFFLDSRRGAFTPRRLEHLAGVRTVIAQATDTWLLTRKVLGQPVPTARPTPTAWQTADDELRRQEVIRTANQQAAPSDHAIAGNGTAPQGSPEPMTLDEVQRRHIEQTLRDTQGVIEGPNGAAHRMGIKPSTLRSRMRKLGAVNPLRP